MLMHPDPGGLTSEPARREVPPERHIPWSRLIPIQARPDSHTGINSFIYNVLTLTGPFQNAGPQPLRIIKVASKDHYERPLFNMPHVWMSVHHNEYISDSM